MFKIKDIINKVHCADALEFMRQIPDGVIHCGVTSPPYYRLRQYLFDKAIILRYNLTEEEIKYVNEELIKYNVKPRN